MEELYAKNNELKNDWIKAWTTDRWKGSDIEVIKFIANILFQSPNNSEAIHTLFACGYCFYFANMLKLRINRGHVMWVKEYSHIIWYDDEADIAYDISGIYYDYNGISMDLHGGTKGFLVPVEQLHDFQDKGGLESFMH